MQNIDDKDLGMICLTIIAVGIIIAACLGQISLNNATVIITNIMSLIGGAMAGAKLTNGRPLFVKPKEPEGGGETP